jgi:16S rRNA (guanine966-N2)-methyltransferase
MPRPSSKGLSGQVRIIGGRWRGRRLQFPDLHGLRPTTDRNRETLFNWLSPVIHDSLCLDLFAGSGALGFEALSRGAARCDFVDSAAPAVRSIRAHLTTLGVLDSQCYLSDALSWLRSQAPPRGYDVVFLDPPYAADLVAECLQQISTPGHLAAEAWVYVELAKTQALPELPSSWQIWREKHAGGTSYRLLRVRHANL